MNTEKNTSDVRLASTAKTYLSIVGYVGQSKEVIQDLEMLKKHDLKVCFANYINPKNCINYRKKARTKKMAEYIEREAALKIIDNYGKTVTADSVVVVEAIKDIVGVITPAADVVEVKHGKNLTKMNPVDEFICSECGVELCDMTEFRIDVDNEDECFFEFEVKFCPNCGVKIRE